MAANHAGRAARRVDEDPVERPAVPPLLRRRRVARDELGGEAESVEVLAHELDALASRSTAHTSLRPPVASRMWPVFPPGAAHASSTRWPAATLEQRGRALRRQVLHRHLARGEPGQRLDADGVCNEHGRLDVRCRGGGDSGGGELGDVIGARRAHQVHAQPQRRSGIVGRENRLPVARMIGAQRVDEPARMRESRLGHLERRLLELLALPLEAAQHRVDETTGATRAEQRRGVDGRGYCGVRRYAQLLQLQQADAQQRGELRLLARERPCEKAARLPFEPVVPTQAAENERREQRLIAAGDTGRRQQRRRPGCARRALARRAGPRRRAPPRRPALQATNATPDSECAARYASASIARPEGG